MKKQIIIRKAAALAVALSCLLSGCSAKTGTTRALPEGAEPYAIPPFQDAVFQSDQAEDYGMLQIDFSGTEQGYIGVRANSDKQLKFQIQCGDMKYNYNISNSGETTILPLNMESGSYTFRLLENSGGNKYAVPWVEDRQIDLENEFVPFLRPSQMVPYSQNSECVKLARELAANCEKDSDVVAAVYRYLVKNISYDSDKAATVENGYLPNPDATLSERKGICFDYASLAAAMIRSLGIPCKLITGYLDTNLYHAWNCFYLKEQGWVTVEIKARPGLWQRVDITMAASGKKATDLEDDTRYTTRYTY